MQKITNYKIIEPLKEQGHTKEYLAYTPSRLNISDEFVIIQTHKQQLIESDFLKVCQHLATAMSTKSPFISKVFDVGQSGDVFYITSEYLQKETLDNHNKDISRIDVLEILSSISLGIETLHNSGIAHGDIHPSNIWLNNAVAKINNIAILPVINPGQTLASTEHSIPIEYKYPPHIQGEPNSRLSDIWSLGVTLHKSLTGESIYPNMPTNSLLSSVQYVLNNPPQLSESLRNGEHKIIEKSLQIDPKNYYNSAEEFSEDLLEEANRQKGVI